MASRRFLIVIILLFSFVFLISCGEKTQIDSSKQSNTADAGVKLNFRITWKDYSGRGEAIQKIVDSYNEEKSGDSAIAMVGGDEDIAAIEELLKSGSETVYVLPYRFVKYFSDKGYLCKLQV